MKILHNENYKILLKEIKEDIINGNASYVHGLEDVILLIFGNTQSDVQI